MAKNKARFLWLGLFAITVLIWGFATPALSETLTCKSESDSGKQDFDQVIRTLYLVGATIQEAVATCDNGEKPTVKMYSVWDATVGKENFSQGYVIYIFKDFSRIVTKFNFRQIPDPGGRPNGFRREPLKLSRGALRFDGIKGNISSKSKVLYPDQRSVNEWTIHYTLPSK